jgi:hypothetical protein
MMLPMVLSSDELRAAARLAGWAPLPVFDTSWVSEEVGIADAVAIRGLLARGLATVRDVDGCPEAGLTSAASAALNPLLRPDAIVEIHRDSWSSGRRCQMTAEADGSVVLAEEREPLVWQVHQRSGSAELCARPVVTCLIEELAETERAAQIRDMAVTPNALAAAQTLVAQGHAKQNSDPLVGLLAEVSVTVTVRMSRQVDPSTRVTAAVTWLDAGKTGIWLVEPADGATDPDDDLAEMRAVTLIATDRETLLARVEEILWH